MRRLFLIPVTMLLVIFLVCGCATMGGVIDLGYAKINIIANLTSKPEKNLKVYAVEGIATGNYEKTGPRSVRAKGIEYKNEKKFLGTTPLTYTLTFHHYPLKGGYVWTPTQYAVYFVSSDGTETSVIFGAWTLLWKDVGTGEIKEMLYNPKEFPYDFFVKHQHVKEMNIPFNFCVEIKE